MSGYQEPPTEELEAAAEEYEDEEPDLVNPPTLQNQPGPNQLLERLVNAFNLYDIDKNGTLHIGELYGVLVFELGQKQFENNFPEVVRVMNYFDQSRDGELNIDEFMAIFFSTPVTPAPEPPDTGDDGDKFTDADFPPNVNSIGAIDGFPPEQAVWVRAPDLTPGTDHLFFNIEPNDISQGYLGDCWLLACLSCAAEFPGLVESLFMNKTIAEDGKYSLKLHDGQKWQQVIIDDYIPTIQGKPAFSKPHDNELWVLLIEKACAKFCQSYAAMEGGMFGCGFMMFTGCTEQYFFNNMEGMSSPWQKIKQTYAPVTNAGNATNSQQVGEVDSEQFFQYLKTGDAQNYMMGAGTFKDAPSSGEQGFSGGEDIGASGIVKGHAYSLLQVREEQADGQTMRMIQCRNPWGNHVEWKGAFSDGSPEWYDHPELRELLGVDFKDDGLFWMTWEDFVAAMSFVCVGPQSVKTPKRQLLKQRDIPTCPANNNSYSRADPTANGRVRINSGPCQACVGADCVVM